LTEQEKRGFLVGQGIKQAFYDQNALVKMVFAGRRKLSQYLWTRTCGLILGSPQVSEKEREMADLGRFRGLSTRTSSTGFGRKRPIRARKSRE
jgi:hypothetical protein